MSTVPADPARLTATHIRVLIGALLTSIAFSITITGLSFFTSAILEDHPEWSIGGFTLYYMVYGLASAFIMPVAAQMHTKLGSRGLLVLGGVIAGLGLFLFSLATAMWMFYGAALIIGLGVGMSVQYVPILVVNSWFVARKALILGIVLGGTGIGGALFSIALPTIILNSGWEVGMVAMAVVMLICTLVPGLLLIRNTPESVGLLPYGATPQEATAVEEDVPAEEKPGLTRAQALASPLLYLLFAAVLLLGIVNSMNQHLVTYLNLSPWGINVSAANVSMILTVTTLSLLFLKPAIGAMIDAIGLEKTLVITFAIAAAGSLIWAFSQLAWISAIAAVMLALSFAHGTVSPPLIVQRAFGERAYPALWGILGSAYPIGTAVGAPIWGAVRDVTGSYGWGWVTVPLVMLFYVAVFIIVMRRGRAMWSPETPQAISPTRR